MPGNGQLGQCTCASKFNAVVGVNRGCGRRSAVAKASSSGGGFAGGSDVHKLTVRQSVLPENYQAQPQTR